MITHAFQVTFQLYYNERWSVNKLGGCYLCNITSWKKESPLTGLSKKKAFQNTARVGELGSTLRDQASLLILPFHSALIWPQNVPLTKNEKKWTSPINDLGELPRPKPRNFSYGLRASSWFEGCGREFSPQPSSHSSKAWHIHLNTSVSRSDKLAIKLKKCKLVAYLDSFQYNCHYIRARVTFICLKFVP